MANQGFGKMVDWFGVESTSLKLKSSDNGATKPLTEVSHTGTIDAQESASVRLNPTCTYEVVENTNVVAQLGKAYAQGYFITSVSISTQTGAFPFVTITANENEGVDAINRWDVTIPVIARAQAQNLLGAIEDGVQIVDCKVTAKADPVVLYENNAPSASDIVHGKLVLNARIVNGDGEASASTKNGFIITSNPITGSGVDYSSLSLTAERTL